MVRQIDPSSRHEGGGPEGKTEARNPGKARARACVGEDKTRPGQGWGKQGWGDLPEAEGVGYGAEGQWGREVYRVRPTALARGGDNGSIWTGLSWAVLLSSSVAHVSAVSWRPDRSGRTAALTCLIAQPRLPELLEVG